MSDLFWKAITVDIIMKMMNENITLNINLYEFYCYNTIYWYDKGSLYKLFYIIDCDVVVIDDPIVVIDDPIVVIVYDC